MMAGVVSIWMDGLRGQILDKKHDFEGKVQKIPKPPESLSRTHFYALYAQNRGLNKNGWNILASLDT